MRLLCYNPNDMNHDIKTPLLEELQWRGLVHQCSDLAALDERLQSGPITLYCGFDPTADSLHVGSLIPLLALRRFQLAGHRVLALVGGATGLIGDPSGKSAERVLQSADDVAVRVKGLRAQVAQFLDLENPERGLVVNNLAWTAGVGVLDFLREVGKHFSVNAMVARDSVRSRLDREGEGISFTEFSYMLLQAFDFLRLNELENCTLQIGGSDQWGNMCSGTDLIRRKHGGASFALTFPLLTTADGQKFGKTVKGAVWLDAAKTSPWEFFQFWLNVDDQDVVRFLKLFTFLSRENIEQLARDTTERPQERRAQRRLAVELTALVHGDAAAQDAVATAGVLFGKDDPRTLTASALVALASALPVVKVDPANEPPLLTSLLVALGLETSMTRASEAVKSGAAAVNGVKVTDPKTRISWADSLEGEFFLLRKGKKSFGMVRLMAQPNAGDQASS